MAISSINSVSNYYTQAAAAGPVSVATALAALKANARSKVAISDTTENIARNLDLLSKNSNNVTQITQSDPTTAKLSLTASQLSNYTGVLGKFNTDYKVDVADATVAGVNSLTNNSHVASFSITDTSAKISSQFDSLSVQSKLTKINVSTPSISLNLAATQLANNTNTVNKIGTNYSLSITNATADQAVSYATNLRIKSVAIMDHADAISNNLDALKALGLRIKEIRSDDTNVFKVSADQLRTDALVVGKLYKGYQLSILNASMGQTQSLYTDKKVVSVDIVDTAANISNRVDLLTQIGSDLNSIHITDPGQPLQMTSAQFAAQTQTLSKIKSTDNYTINITKATVTEAQALSQVDKITQISVLDNNNAVSATLDSVLQNSKVSDVNITGKNTTITLTNDQLGSNANNLSKIKSNYLLNVNNVPINSLGALMEGNTRLTSFSLSGNASDITDKLNTLSSLGSRVTQISQGDANVPLNLTVEQWKTYSNVLTKITQGYNLNLSGVSADKAQALARDTHVQALVVSDSASAISAQLDKLHSLGSQLSSIALTDANQPIDITASQWVNEASTLAKLGDSYKLRIHNATADQVAVMVSDSHISAIDIADTASQLSANFDNLQSAISAHSEVSLSVRQIDNATPIPLTATQLRQDANVLDRMTGNYSLAVSEVAADQAGTLAQNNKVASIAVTDTGAAIATQLETLSSLGLKVKSLSQKDPSNSVPITWSQWNSYNGVLSKFQGGLHASVREVPASQASRLLRDARISEVAIQDSGTQISANLDALQGLGSMLSQITQTDPGIPLLVSMRQLYSASNALGKMANYSLIVQDATAQDAQKLLGSDYTHVTGLAVVDTSASISANWDWLSANAKLTSMTQTGPAQSITLTKEQRRDGASALAKIAGSFSLSITNAKTADISTLMSDAVVASFYVSDSASNVVNNLDLLQATGTKLKGITLDSDNDDLSMSYAQWISNQNALNKITQSYTVNLSNVGAAAASITATDPRIKQMSVSDSTDHINSNLTALQNLGSKVSDINPTESGAPPNMSLTASQRNANSQVLSKITDANYSLFITQASTADATSLMSDPHVAAFSLTDTASNIAAAWDILNANNKLTDMSISGPVEPLVMAADMFVSSADTLAKFQTNYSLTVNQASAALASDLQSNNHVSSFDVADTSSAVGSLLTQLSDFSKINAMAVTRDDGNINLTQTQFDDLADPLSQMTGSFNLAVSNVSMDDLDRVVAAAHVSQVSIQASSGEVSSRFDDLVNLADTLGDITLSDASIPIALTQTQLSQGGSTLDKISSDYHLALVDVLAENATDLATQAHVDSLSVADSASNISAQFDNLVQLSDTIDVVQLKDSEPITLTQAQFDAGSALLAKIMGNHEVVISE
jgi:hypothetical protein